MPDDGWTDHLTLKQIIALGAYGTANQGHEQFRYEIVFDEQSVALTVSYRKEADAQYRVQLEDKNGGRRALGEAGTSTNRRVEDREIIEEKRMLSRAHLRPRRRSRAPEADGASRCRLRPSRADNTEPDFVGRRPQAHPSGHDSGASIHHLPGRRRANWSWWGFRFTHRRTSRGGGRTGRGWKPDSPLKGVLFIRMHKATNWSFATVD